MQKILNPNYFFQLLLYVELKLILIIFVFFFLLKLAFRHAQNQARDIRHKIKQILQLTNDRNSTVLEETIEKYLRSTIQKYDIEKIAFVCTL
jgi:uncharacterized protein YpmS